MTSSPIPNRPFGVIIQAVLERLTRPHAFYEGIVTRRKMRTASAMLLILAVLFSLEPVVSPLPESRTTLTILTAALLFVCYGASRTRFTEWAIMSAMLLVLLSLFGRISAIADWSRTSTLQYFIWLEIPILLSSLVLTPQATLKMALLTNIATLTIPLLLMPAIRVSDFGESIGFLSTISIIVVAATYLQEYYFVRPQLEVVLRAQKELEAKNRALEKSNNEIKDFSYIIAHDLRAPAVTVQEYVKEMQYLLGLLKPVLAAGVEAVSPTERPAIQTILQDDLPEATGYLENAAARMQGIISEVLKVARAGQTPLHIQPIDLAVLVNQVLSDFAPQAAQVSIVVKSLPSTIQADPFVFKQTLSNLIDNALKYLNPNQQGYVEISTEQYSNEIVISVSDNGRGIAPDEQNKVFQPFRRASNTEGIAGLGVGLYYVRALVERHGGRIWFASHPDHGTTFSFSIPQQDRQRQSDDQHDSSCRG